MTIRTGSLLSSEKSITGSPTGSPIQSRKMLEFCARHDIYPTVEEFPASKINEAFEHLESGKARYRVVVNMME